MKRLDLDLSGVKLCISVDDVPVHGPSLPEYSRLDIVKRFTNAFSHHGVVGVYGFVNGALMQPTLMTQSLRKMASFKPTRKLVNVSARLKFDLSCYINSQITETSNQNQELLEHWIEAGHFLANHNYWHSDLNNTDVELFIAGIERNQKLISRFPSAPTKLFRYPYLKEGNTATKRDAIRKYLADNNFKIAPVTVNFNDWAWNRTYAKISKNGCTSGDLLALEEKYLEIAVLNLQGSVLAARKLTGRDVNHVLLLHMGVFTAITLDKLLDRFHRLGVSFTTMEEALEDTIFDETLDVIVPGRGRNALEQRLLVNNEPENGILLFAMRSVNNVGDA